MLGKGASASWTKEQRNQGNSGVMDSKQTTDGVQSANWSLRWKWRWRRRRRRCRQVPGESESESEGESERRVRVV